MSTAAAIGFIVQLFIGLLFVYNALTGQHSWSGFFSFVLGFLFIWNCMDNTQGEKQE